MMAVRHVTGMVGEQVEGIWVLVYIYIYDGATSESHFLLLRCWFLICEMRLSLRSFWTVAFYGSASQESPSVNLKRETETLDNVCTLRTSGQMDNMCTLNEVGVLATSILHVAMEMARTGVLLTLSKTPATLFSQFLKNQTNTHTGAYRYIQMLRPSVGIHGVKALPILLTHHTLMHFCNGNLKLRELSNSSLNSYFMDRHRFLQIITIFHDRSSAEQKTAGWAQRKREVFSENKVCKCKMPSSQREDSCKSTVNSEQSNHTLACLGGWRPRS